MENKKILRREIGKEYFIEYEENGNAWFGVREEQELVPIRYMENIGLYPREDSYVYEFDKILLMITAGEITRYLEDGGLNICSAEGEPYPYGAPGEIMLESEKAFGDYELQVADALAEGQSDLKNIYLAAPNAGNKILLMANVAADAVEAAKEKIRREIFTENYMANVEDKFRFLIGINMDD